MFSHVDPYSWPSTSEGGWPQTLVNNGARRTDARNQPHLVDWKPKRKLNCWESIKLLSSSFKAWRRRGRYCGDRTVSRLWMRSGISPCKSWAVVLVYGSVVSPKLSCEATETSFVSRLRAPEKL